MPLDGGYRFLGNPLFGPTKTLRGILSALLITSLTALLVGITVPVGAAIALLAMVGDLISSFIKRRLNRPSSSMFLGLDQIPEALLPLWYCKAVYSLDWQQVIILLTAFVLLELLLSRILFVMKIRKRPY